MKEMWEEGRKRAEEKDAARAGGRKRQRERARSRRKRVGGGELDAGVGTHLPIHMYVSSSPTSPPRRAALCAPSVLPPRRPADPCGPLAPRSIPLTPTRAARAWRFTLNAGPLPPVPQRRARALPRGERGTRQRQRNEAAKGREQCGRRQGGREEPSFSRSPCLPSFARRTEEKIVRKYADTKHGEPMRARFARQKRFPRSLGFDRDPPLHLDAFAFGQNARYSCVYTYTRLQFSRLFGKFLDHSPCVCLLLVRVCFIRYGAFSLPISFFLFFCFLLYEQRTIF